MYKLKVYFPTGMSRFRGYAFREGDIAGLGVRSAISCPNQNCLWPKSVDGFVYVPYIISPLYGESRKKSIYSIQY